MNRLTVRLPGTLHKQLTALAEQEGVSLNQYIVYALTRQVTLDRAVQAVPQEAIAEQRASYAALLQGLGWASFEEIEATVAEREATEPEEGLSPETMKRLRKRVTGARSSEQEVDALS